MELICAQKISLSQTAYLDILIQEYLESRSEIPLKPKHHFLLHYAALLLKFSPLIRLWTLRFESKHSYFKRCARHLKKLQIHLSNLVRASSDVSGISFRWAGIMSDSEPTFLHDAIMEVLPELPAVTKNILEEHMQSIGVETHADLRFIEEADLMTVLRPVQARKLLSVWKQKCKNATQLWGTPENSSISSEASPDQSLSLISVSPQSSSSTSSSSPQLDTHWEDNFEIPWTKFPEELMQPLERGKRPGPKLRRQMVRIVVTEMMEKCPHVGKKHSTDVAKKMVSKYPKSLQDIIEGDIVGTGYHSLVKQLKRKHESNSDDTDEIPLEERAAMQDTYGCIKWNVQFLPREETQESQQQKMEKLKEMFQQSNANPEEVKGLMKSTFYTQRQHVNQGKSIKCLREDWPFLFDEIGMSVHFKELTGINLKETFIRNLDLKGKRLLNYLTTVCVKKNKKFLQTNARLQRMRGQQSGCSEDVKEMVLLLLSYFDEKEESIFFYVDETSLAEDVQLEQVSLTPAIIVCGNLDQTLINTNIPSFISALCLMFGSYYCFNIHYPSELASTLEFLQRCFFTINPEKGTKVENKNSKRRLNLCRLFIGEILQGFVFWTVLLKKRYYKLLLCGLFVEVLHFFFA
uniref:SAM domain-containing protein n=1 Tax=Pygocentrus nattereri TaxID=42514 RepID=A0AAR2JY98_PYGNA